MKILNNLPAKTDIQEQIGNLSHLKTILKNNLVASINSLYETFLDKTGTADISDTGDGTVTGAIKALSMIAQTLDAAASQKVANDDTTTSSGYVADARIVKIHGDEIDALKAENSSLNTNLANTLSPVLLAEAKKAWYAYDTQNLTQYRAVLITVEFNERVLASSFIPIKLFRNPRLAFGMGEYGDRSHSVQYIYHNAVQDCQWCYNSDRGVAGRIFSSSETDITFIGRIYGIL